MLHSVKVSIDHIKTMKAHKEIEVDLADQNPSNVVPCVPIKKRLFNSMQASTSPLKETYLMPQSCSELSKKLREDSFAPENNDNLAFDMNVNLNMSKRPSLGIVLEEAKRLSVPNKSRVFVGDGISEKKLATGNQEYHGLSSPKQEKDEAHSLDVPVINGLQFRHQTSENNLDSENDSSVLCANRFNWDLNVPMDAWNASAVIKHDIDRNFNRGSIHEKKLCRWVDQLAPGRIGSDLILDASMTEQNKHNDQSRNLRILTDGKDHEGDLVLQLRPPSRPELCINWDKESLPHLSLSLPVNLSDEFCSAVNPEPYECRSSKDTEMSKCSVHSVSKHDSRPCSGNFQSETCKEIDPSQRPSSPGRVVNPIAHKELQVKQPDLELDNNQLTSSAMEPILGEPIAVSMNSEASHVADMLPDEVPIIKSNKRTCSTINRTPVSNSNMACKDVGVHSDVCAQLAEASICKSLDNNQLTSSAIEPILGEPIAVSMNSEASHVAEMLPDEVPIIKFNISTCSTMNRTRVSNSDMACKDVGVHSDVCAQLAEASICKSLDNDKLISSAMEPTLGEPIAVSMNSEASHVADMLPDEVPIIKSNKSTCPTMNRTLISNSDMACKDVGVHSDACARLAEASICKSLDNNQLTSSAMEPILGEPIAVSVNSEASHVIDMLPDEVPIMKSDKSIYPTMTCTPVLNSDMTCKDVGVHSGVCAQLAEASICKPLDIVEHITLDSKGNNVTENEICETANPSTLHSQFVHMDLKEPMAADGMSDGSAEMDCSDDELYTSKIKVIGDVHLEHDKKSLSNEKNGKGTKPHAKIQKEQLIGNEQQVNDLEGIRTSEDGIAGVAGSYVISEDFRSSNSEHVATESIGSENEPIVSDIHLDRSDKRVVPEDSRNTISAKKFDAIINHGEKKTSCNTASSSSTGVLVPTTSKRPNKPSQGVTENYSGKKCSEELKSKTIKSSSAILKTGKARTLIGQNNNGGASVLGKYLELSGRDSDASGNANKYIDKLYHSQNKKVNVGCKFNENSEVSSFIIRTNGQRTHVSSRAVGDGLVKDCHGLDRHPQDRRHSKFVSNNQDPQFGKYNSSYKNIRRNKNRDFDRGDDTQYAPRINNSGGYQFRRNHENLESPIDFAPNGYAENAGRLSRRPTDVRSCHSSFLSRRHLQSPEEGSELLGTRSSGRSLREISPDRFVGREFHDNLSDYELMRSVPCEMRNNLLYPHPHMHYDSRDRLPRRRSSSPNQRRASPAHLHGPPQAVRLRSPHSRHCFPEDEAIRDPSPSYPQFSSHMREMQPAEDLELPTPPVMNRTTRRLDLGQYETEYPDPRHFTDQLVDARNYDQRLHVQSLRPHLMPREVAEDILHYPADDYAYEPTDHCPDSEMFHSRGGSRDFESHLSNRPRNASDRIMSTREQGEDLRYHSRQGWRHHQLDNDRAKRRRR